MKPPLLCYYYYAITNVFKYPVDIYIKYVILIHTANYKEVYLINSKPNIQIITDNLGRKIVVIPQILFYGKRSIPWKDVESYLLRYVGEIIQITESNDIVYIGKDFPDEFSGSEYTRKLRGSLAKAKANMVQGLPQMIEIATKKRWREDFEHKHNKRAENGWYRYNTLFALPIMDDFKHIIGYNVYQAVLIIRHAADQKLYLYDIQNIKKETSNPFWTKPSNGQKPISFL